MRVKSFLAALAIAAMAISPMAGVQATSVPFSNYSFTTVANSESYRAVVSRTKPDAEQRWYLTMTKLSRTFSSTSETPIAVSAKNSTQAKESAPLYLKSGSQSKAYGSDKGIGKGTRCTLYVSGNDNAKSSYSVTISGRYSS